MGDEQARKRDHGEHRQLDHALHEAKREESEQQGDEDGEDRHFRRFVPVPSTSLTTP